MKPIRASADTFRRLAEGILPKDGIVTIWDDEAGRLVVQVAWRLPADAFGIRALSHPVRIIFMREALEDYDQGTAETRQVAEQRFEEWLKRRTRMFNPVRGPISRGRPPDEWIVRPNYLI